jgi:hypothetical protein
MITERTEVSAQAVCTTDAPSRVGASPWLLWGGLIGLVQIFAIATVQPLGVSTAYPQLVGYLVDKIVSGFAESQPYLQKIGAKIGWEVIPIAWSEFTNRAYSCLPYTQEDYLCADENS